MAIAIDLAGKVVLITGAAQGIGATTALTLAQAGADLVLHYGSSQAKAEALATQINSLPDSAASRPGTLEQSQPESRKPERCLLVQTDLRSPEAAQVLWQTAIRWRGQIDVVVNNAAIMPAAGVTDDWSQWTEAWQSTLQVNLIATADLCRLAISHFQTRGGGILVNMASRAAFRGDGPEYMHYAASKGGLIALTRSIARGFAQDNILAYAVAPGFVRTERIEQVMQQRGEAYVTRDIPLGQPAPPQDVANVITFLAAGLAPHATGTTVDINGASYVR